MQNIKEIYEPKITANLKNPLTPADYKLINYYKQIGYGELHVIIRNGMPVKIHTSLKSVLLFDDKRRR